MRQANDQISQRYETVFCIFMVVLAFLYRDNTQLVYPQVLYLFLLLLSFNLAAGYAFRHWPHQSWISALVILSNCAVITAILIYSGKETSNLWVLYLLPIYTVCLLLTGRQVVLVLAGVISFNAVLYQFSVDGWDHSVVFDFLMRTGIFCFATAATYKIVNRDRRGREKIINQRMEMEQLEDRIHLTEMQLKESEKMADMGQLTGGIAHDLNNPITVIVGTVKFLLEDENLSLPIRPDLERIARSAQLCQVITSNVLAASRSKDFSFTENDIQEIVESAFGIYEDTLRRSNIQIVKDYAPHLPRVKVSAPHLQRVFLNLMSNARAAMKKGGELKVRTELAPLTPGMPVRMIQVIVEDTGPGVAPEMLTNIFKPFNTTKAPAEGTGLGLYLSREIAQRHNGGLRVENKPEGGARFTLYLPAQSAESLAA